MTGRPAAIVAQTHLGLGADIALAGSVREIDLIVGGHSHHRMHDALRVGDTLIVQAGAHGSDLGRIDLVVERGRIVSFTRSLVAIDTSVVPDPDVAAIIAVVPPAESRIAGSARAHGRTPGRPLNVEPRFAGSPE